MSTAESLLPALACVWAVLLWRTRREIRRAPRLPRSVVAAGEDTPLVSILLPARDEADRMLTACVRSLLAQDYPRFEIVAVDDRSTDETGDLLRRLAEGSRGRMTVLEGAEPPPGWVGKQHALAQAARRARGDWLLAVDADALYGPSLLADAVALARARNADALSLLARVGAGDFWVSITYPLGFWALLAAAPFGRVNRRGTRTALAWGGFLLLRRAVYEAVGGYAAVRAETSEDTKMAALLKRRGYAFHAALAVDRLYTPMYPTFGELWRGTMKNVYCGPVMTPVIAAFLATLGVLPTVWGLAAAFHGAWPAAAAGGLCWALFSLSLVPVYRLHRIAAWRAAFAPLGAAICTAQMLCTGWLVAVTGQGIEWRGRRLRTRPAPPLLPTARRRSPR